MYIQYNYTLEFAISTKNMELLKLYSKEKTNIFCLIKLLFFKVRCLYCLIPFVGSNLWVETFLNKREHQKRMC